MYIKFSLESKQVVKISSSPIDSEEGYGIVYLEISNLSEGDEFENVITLDVQEINGEYLVKGYSTIRCSPTAEEILRQLDNASNRINSLLGDNLVLQQAIIELTIVLGSMVGE